MTRTFSRVSRSSRRRIRVCFRVTAASMCRPRRSSPIRLSPSRASDGEQVIGDEIMKRLVYLTALTLVAAMPLFAQPALRTATRNFASDYQTIPVVANVAGVGGSRFQTYVSIFNPTSSAFSVTASLFDANGTRKDATINLAAGELKS